MHAITHTHNYTQTYINHQILEECGQFIDPRSNRFIRQKTVFVGEKRRKFFQKFGEKFEKHQLRLDRELKENHGDAAKNRPQVFPGEGRRLEATADDAKGESQLFVSRAIQVG